MAHQIDGNGVRSVLPEDIEWKPFPAFPPSARLAVVVGDPTEPGPVSDQGQAAWWGQADAARAPGGSRLTVVSGVFYIGLRERFDSEKLESYPPGSVIVLPGGTPTSRGPVNTSPK